MKWIELTSAGQVADIISNSSDQPVLIFKHSTSCNISHMVKLRLENGWQFPIPSYFLDLKAHRDISRLVADKFAVHHESPQVLVIKDGDCIFDASHFDVSVAELNEICLN